MLPNLPARITTTLITLAVMSPFLKALIGWETILPIFVKEKVANILCKISRRNSEETKQSVSKTFEDSFGICSVEGETENARNFFVSNHKTAALYYKLWTAKKINRLPLIMLTSFRLLVVLFFIVTVVHQLLTENPKVTLLMAFASILVLSQSRWLFQQYVKIESQFLTNLNGNHSNVEAAVSDKKDEKKAETKEDKKEITADNKKE